MVVVRLVRPALFFVAMALAAAVAHAVPPGEPRAIAIIEALSTGDPAVYEKAAQAHFAPALLARRTPAERAAMVAQVHADFGALEIDTINVEGEALVIVAQGKGGRRLRFTFLFDGTPDARIKAIEIDAGDSGDEAAVKLPPLVLQPGAGDGALARTLDAWIGEQVRSDAFAGVVLVARDGKPVFLRAYGAADRARKIAANEDTAYNVASIGKKFTQVAIAKLVQDGKLKRTATVGEILPDYPNAASRAATIDQLLTMKGGIADFFGPGFDKADKGKLNSNHAYYAYVSKLPPRFAPGAKREYCNGCYVVLGEIVERVSGVPFETFVARTVFAPAGMTRSGYFNSAALPSNTAIRYGRPGGPGTPYVDTGAFHGAAGSAAGGVYASAKDLLAFDEALRAGRLLDAATTGWVLNGQAIAGRNPAPMGIAGGAPGTNAVLESGGPWTVIVTANVDPPLPEKMGIAIARALVR